MAAERDIGQFRVTFTQSNSTRDDHRARGIAGWPSMPAATIHLNQTEDEYADSPLPRVLVYERYPGEFVVLAAQRLHQQLMSGRVSPEILINREAMEAFGSLMSLFNGAPDLQSDFQVLIPGKRVLMHWRAADQPLPEVWTKTIPTDDREVVKGLMGRMEAER